MKKLAKYTYFIKMLLFVIHFYFVFMMLRTILDTKIYGIIFLIFYLIFAIKVITEILSKKQRYKNDFIYSLMQIGLMVYLMFLSIKISLEKVYVTRITISYFRINFIILSILIVFILVYSYLEFKSSVK